MSFMKFGMVMHTGPPDSISYKIYFLNAEDGRRRPFWKSKDGDISATVWPISTKFWKHLLTILSSNTANIIKTKML